MSGYTYTVDWSRKKHIRQNPPRPEDFARLDDYLRGVCNYARDVIRMCGYDPDDFDALPRPDDGVIAGDLFVGMQILVHAREALRIYDDEVLRIATNQGLSPRGTGKLMEHIYHLGVYSYPHRTIYGVQMSGGPPLSLTDDVI